MARRIFLPVLIVCALLAASCAGDSSSDGYDVADRVLEELGQPVGEQAASLADCDVVEVVDEYGFKSEISLCPLASPATTQVAAVDITEAEAEDLNADQLLNAVGDLPAWALTNLVAGAHESLQPSLQDMVTTVEELDQTCGSDFFGWRASLSELADQAEVLSNQIAAGEGDGYIGTTDARAMSRALMERSLLQTGCVNPGGGAPFTTDELTADGTLELTSRAALGLSELGRLIDNASSGYLFHFFTTADNYEWLRTQTENVELIVYGTSQAGAGIDVVVLGEQMAANAGNAFLYGSLAEVQQHWFPEVERYVDAETVVWLVGAIDLLIDCEPVGRERQFTDRVERRVRTFAPSGWFSEVDQVNLLLGPVGPPNTNKGNGIKKAEPDPAALESHAQEYKDRFATAQFCQSRADTISSAVDRMANDGRRVVVVGMPLSPIAYEALPGGSTTASEAVATLGSQLGQVNVDVIDLTAVLQDRPEIWADYTHLTLSGATVFTELLTAELKKLGL